MKKYNTYTGEVLEERNFFGLEVNDFEVGIYDDNGDLIIPFTASHYLVVGGEIGVKINLSELHRFAKKKIDEYFKKR